MDGLGNIGFETFTGGELKSNVGIIQESVQDWIALRSVWLLKY